jgi:sulfide dehydrogenase cytochrome subunit
MLKLSLKTVIIYLAFFTTLLSAQTIKELSNMCNDCHGAFGVSSNADIPSIAGFSETSITDMLLAFSEELRPAIKGRFRHGDVNRPETDMVTIAKALTEHDIDALAIYYSKQKFVAANQTFDMALAEQGKKIHQMRCTKCHEEGGSLAEDDAGIIAGQWTPYLRTAFKEYRTKQRTSEKGMLTKVNALTEKQVEALIQYYASQQ